jgi:hypothetical protein
VDRILKHHSGTEIKKWRTVRCIDGGRDRDRTCDPYHVKVVLFR